MSITIRKAKQEDLSAIAALHEGECWHFTTLQEIQQFLQQGHMILVAETDGKVVGKIDLLEKTRQGQNILSLQRLVVHPDYRKQGIAGELLSAAEGECKERRIQCMDVAVKEENTFAKSFYEKQGFKERARRIYLRKEV